MGFLQIILSLCHHGGVGWTDGLWLQNNKISGSIPTELGNMRFLCESLSFVCLETLFDGVRHLTIILVGVHRSLVSLQQYNHWFIAG